MTPPTCGVCATASPVELAHLQDLIQEGYGYRALCAETRFSVWACRMHIKHTRAPGFDGRSKARHVKQKVKPAEASKAEADAIESAKLQAQREWFAHNGIELPPEGTRLGMASVQVVGQATYTDDEGNTKTVNPRSWLRVIPMDTEEDLWELRQADPVQVRIKIAARLPKRQPSTLKTAVIFGDTQIGWWLDPVEDVWHTTHDAAAIDVFLQVLADIEAEHGVDEVINDGDHADFPMLSRHRSSPSVTERKAVNRTIQTGTELNAMISAICPSARKRWVRGNHCDRLILWLIDHAPHLVGIMRAHLPGEERQKPALGLDFLYRCEETGWELVGPYPEGRAWLSPRTKVIHGDCAKPTSVSTGQTYLARNEEDTFYGHSHRAGETRRVVQTASGPREYVAASFGALCRTDGAVPSAKSGHNDDGTPGMQRGETWDQGFGLVFYDPDDLNFTPLVERVSIRNGQAWWRGRHYVAQCDSDGNPLAA